MKLLYSAIFFLFITTTAYAEHNFIGVYKCEGYDPYLKKNYIGTLTISQQNVVYKISMKYDTGESYRATGGLYGDNLLSVVFQDVKNLKKVGLEQYQWDDKVNKMGGFWVYLGEDKLGHEICEKQS